MSFRPFIFVLYFMIPTQSNTASLAYERTLQVRIGGLVRTFWNESETLTVFVALLEGRILLQVASIDVKSVSNPHHHHHHPYLLSTCSHALIAKVFGY